MDYLNLPINKAQHYLKIIEDTEEIIQNFKDISEIMIEKLEKTETSMYTLGKKVVHEREDFLNPNANLGNNKINLV